MTPAAGFDRARIKFLYDWAADRYLRSLPLEHFMEGKAQATQREITLESLALVRAARPEVQVFNELLVLYPPPGGDPDTPERVVPDNMVVVHPDPIEVDGNFNTLLQPAGPLLVLEYVSKGNKRKDYDDNHRRYERDLKVPYYLLFYPDNEELTLFRMADGRYLTVLPNAAGRLAIPELELEAALLDGWVRFWFRGELLPLPGELMATLNETRRDLLAERQARAAAEHRAATAEHRATTAEQRATTAEQRATTAEQRATTAEQRADAERQARAAVEAELARLREELARARGGD